jgi:sodium/glucose cotransporter 2
LPWYAAAGSLFASNIGNEHFVGQAGTAAHSGLAVALFEWTAVFSVMALGFVFGPIYLKNSASTMVRSQIFPRE